VRRNGGGWEKKLEWMRKVKGYGGIVALKGTRKKIIKKNDKTRNEKNNNEKKKTNEGNVIKTGLLKGVNKPKSY